MIVASIAIIRNKIIPRHDMFLPNRENGAQLDLTNQQRNRRAVIILSIPSKFLPFTLFPHGDGVNRRRHKRDGI